MSSQEQLRQKRSGKVCREKRGKPRSNRQVELERRRKLLRAFCRRPDKSANADFIYDYLKAIDTPKSLACWMLYAYNEHAQLVQMTAHPSQYTDYDSFHLDFLAVSFLSKNPFLRTGIKKKQVALDAFKASEHTCARYNHQWKYGYNPSHTIEHLSMFEEMREVIRGILGDFNIGEVFDKCRWGPGVSTLIKGQDVSAAKKYDDECQMTLDAHALFYDALVAYAPRWLEGKEIEIVKGNRIFTVPKNAKTDRTIAIEPGLNIWIQLGIGSVIRKRLRRAGFDLNSDLFNQHLAYLGSLKGFGIATIDFKQASDSICRHLIEALLPRKWFEVLNAARSKFFSFDGENWTYSEKFSSMGNGFTFELESLIFLAAAIVSSRRRCSSPADRTNVSIFGDDVIIPSEAAPLFTVFCSTLGFTVNPSKSFIEGPFRESCGSYYYDGKDVKPFYYKGRLGSFKEIYHVLNSVQLLAIRRGCSNISRDIRFRSCWNLLLHRVPKELRLFGPLGIGDSVIAVNLGERCSPTRHKHWDGFTFPAFVERSVTIDVDSFGLLLAKVRFTSSTTARRDLISLYFGSSEELGNDVGLRGRTRVRYKHNAFFPRWCEIGRWY